MDYVMIINGALYLNALVITVFLVVGIILSGNLQQLPIKIYLCLAIVVLAELLVALSLALISLSLDTNLNWLLNILDMLSFILGYLSSFFFVLFLVCFLRTKRSVSQMPQYAAALITAVSIILAVIASFNNMYALFDENNSYQMQDLFWLGHLLPCVNLLICLILTLRSYNVLNVRERICFTLFPLLNLTCLILEIFLPNLWISNFGVAATLFLIYINLQADQRQKLREQDVALSDARISIMLSQIQPHFLYNSLSAIKQLCKESPRADEAILIFSEYLRGNMSALTQTDCVPFSQELDHVRLYLWLEALRFEERLQVVYDIEVDSFSIPVLSLQPIVENAVRHGVTKDPAGGCVHIKVEESESCYRITVTDDGVGFTPESVDQDGKTHTGLTNVKTRLAALCNARLTITSNPGQGTCALIEIPK